MLTNTDLTVKPKLFPGQHQEKIGKYRLFYNPLGHSGVTLLSGDSLKLALGCDGLTTAGNLVRADTRGVENAQSDLRALVDREVIFWSEETSREIQSQQVKPRSMSCWLHLTNRCNLSCSYCYIDKSYGDLDLQAAVSRVRLLLDSCRRRGIPQLSIKLSGGEPLLRFRMLRKFVRIVREIADDIEVKFVLLTNASLVTPTIAQFLAVERIGVAVSLDGVPAVNDRTRVDLVGVGSSSRVLRGIRYLQDEGRNPTIMATVTKSNYSHLPEFVEFLLDLGTRFRFSLERDSPNGHAELAEHQESLVESLYECYDRIERALPRVDIFRLHTFGDAQFYRPARRACGAGNSFFAIGHDGGLGICGMGLAFPVASLDDVRDDVLSMIRRKSQELISRTVDSYEGCSSCVWRHSCAGACPLQTKLSYGQFATASPYCRTYQAVLPRILRIKGLQQIRVAEERLKGGDEL